MPPENPPAGQPTTLSAAYAQLSAQICTLQMQLREQHQLLLDIRAGQRTVEARLAQLSEQLDAHQTHEVACVLAGTVSAFDAQRATLHNIEAKLNVALAGSPATSPPELRLVTPTGELGQVA